MQAMSIINLLLPSLGEQASPNTLLGLEGGENAFAPLLEGEGIGGLELDVDLANSLNPDGGIVPVPVVSDTAPFPELDDGKAALLAYIQQREGRVSGDVLNQVAKKFGGDASGLPQLDGGIMNPALANEVSNDADFELFAAKPVQKPEGREQEFKVASLPDDIKKQIGKLAPLGGEKVANPLGIDPMSGDDALAELEMELDAEIDAEGEFLKSDSNKVVNSTASNSNTVNGGAAIIAGLNNQVKEEIAEFKTKPIDSEEMALQNTRFKEFDSSRLENQIRVHDKMQMNQTPAEQIKVNISRAVATGIKEIQINLHPAELGKLDVAMEVSEEGETKVRIVAERSETLDLLKKDSSELRNALKELGLSTDSDGLEFSLQEGGADSQEFGDSASQNNNEPDDEYLDLKPINEYQKYGNLDNQSLIMNISQEGLNIVA